MIIGVMGIALFKQCKTQLPCHELGTYSDTTITYVDSIIYIEKEVPVYRLVEVTKPSEIDSSDLDIAHWFEDDQVNPLRFYRDTTVIEPGFKLFYTAKVQGFLNKMQLGYVDNRLDSIIYRETIKTIDRHTYVFKNSFAVGGQINTQGHLTLGGLYRTKKSNYLLGYDFEFKGPRFGYYFTLN